MSLPRCGWFLVCWRDKRDFLADKMSLVFVCIFTNECMLCFVCVCLGHIRIDIQYVFLGTFVMRTCIFGGSVAHGGEMSISTQRDFEIDFAQLHSCSFIKSWFPSCCAED